MIWTTILNLSFADTIDSVLVFSDRAEITRTHSSTCSNGVAEFTFQKLPYNTNVQTLRSEMISSGSVIGVRHKTIVHDDLIDDRARTLLQQKDTLLGEQRSKNDDYTRYTKELQLITSYEKQFTQSLNTELKATKDLRSKWGTGLTTFRKSKVELQQKIHAIHTDLSKLQREIGLIEKQLAVLNVQPSQQSIEATVLTKCNGTGSKKASLHYVVPSASWTPESDLFVDIQKGDSKLKLQVSAQIRQATGEDWTNANITLSTAQPNLGSHALYPAAIRVNGSPNEEQRVMVQSTEDRSSLSNAGYSGQTATNVSIDDNGQSMQLSLPHRTTIVSNGQPHWVPIDQVLSDATISNISIPRVTPYVFETVTFSNPAAYSLLGGTMHLYKDGVFIGDHSHSTTAPGEKMEISLGTLPHLKVERKTLQDRRETKMLGKSQQLQRAYSIAIQNNSSSTEQIEIRESIPLSKNEEISVVLDKEETTGTYVVNDYKGFVVWTMDLSKAESKSVDLVYQIELPSDWQVR